MRSSPWTLKMDRVVTLPLGALHRPLRWRPATRIRLARPVRCAGDPDETEAAADDAEERIARLEAAARGRRVEVEAEPELESETTSPTKRRWSEGEAFPEGWQDMSLGEKAWELYAGERGALFWANKVAFAAAIFVGIAWIFFRFVGPQLGLYELKSTFTS